LPVNVAMTLATKTPIANAEATLRSQFWPRAKRCYQKGLQQDPTQTGKLLVFMRVDPTGEVASASIGSNSGLSVGVSNCITFAARYVKFDAGVGGVFNVALTLERQK
jgi:hypothetical protein